MHAAHVVARLALAAVFVLAGASKVAAGRAWPVQAAALGVPTSVAVVVPWWELVVGATTASGLGEPVPAAAALATLVAFTVVLLRTLRTGRRPACACFGAWSASAIGWRHVARNAAFVAIAVVVLATG